MTVDVTTWTTTTTTLWTMASGITDSAPTTNETRSTASPDNSEPADVQLYVEIHNTERSKPSALDLVWNNTLANAAHLGIIARNTA